MPSHGHHNAQVQVGPPIDHPSPVTDHLSSSTMKSTRCSPLQHWRYCGANWTLGARCRGEGERAGFARLPTTGQEAAVKFAPMGPSFAARGFAANQTTATSEAFCQYRYVHFATQGVLNNRCSDKRIAGGFSAPFFAATWSVQRAGAFCAPRISSMTGCTSAGYCSTSCVRNSSGPCVTILYGANAAAGKSRRLLVRIICAWL